MSELMHRSSRLLLAIAVCSSLILAGSFAGTAGAAQTPISCDPTGATAAGSTPAATPGAAVSVPTQAAIEPEQNPPGDIPDNQAFVTYTSPVGGYAISVPEGWARQENGANVAFSDKLHLFSVETGCGTGPTDQAAAQVEADTTLAQTIPAFELVAIKPVTLPAGPAILIQYRTNSEPDAVTGRQYRLDVDRYELTRNGVRAIISLAGPAGSDNVDVSRQVSESFRWNQ